MAADKTSQETIDEFWRLVIATEKTQTKASAVLPPNVYTQLLGRNVPRGVTTSESVEASYLAAKKDCQKKVAQIISECTIINQKYSDPYFDLTDRSYCLEPLSVEEETDEPSDAQPAPTAAPELSPPSVKRVGDIFDNPRFFVDGANAKDIRQGLAGDCWFLSALMAICNMGSTANLLTKLCVAWDQDVGVYGFVLFRDGEWTSVIVDDKLYLRKPDYEDTDMQTRNIWEDNRIRINSMEEYRKEFQSNSRALHFSQSTDPNETWVPLIEKAFAKIHGDYGAIDGGSVGEAIEDLSGGISTTISTTDILSKDRFWNDCLLKVNDEFLFGCGTQDWHDPWGEGRDGIFGGHAYPILKAVNYGNERLLMMKNPWGRSEWNGPWSDGSSQWNAESIKALGHTFGDDGIFWIRYEDMLRKYETIWKTRLFNTDWRVTQQWTSLNVPWAGEYQDTKFEVVLEKAAATVFVLSQLDDRYFCGLIGQYMFKLSFRVHRAGEEDYLLRTFGEYTGQRSVSAELDLEAGTYEVCLKISAYRNDDADKVEDVVKSNWLDRRNKLLQIGMSYDLAHAKAQLKPKPKEAPKLESKPVPTAVAITVSETPVADEAVSKSKPKGGPSNTIAPALSSEPGLAKGRAGVYVDRQLQVQAGYVYGDDYGSDAGGDPDPAKTADSPAADKATPEEEKKDAPWGAVCVVGLRVYCRGADATIQIVRPKEEEEAMPEGMEGQEGETARLLKLDVDDPARDAAEGVAKEMEEDEENTSDVVDGQGGKGAEEEEEKKEKKEESKEE